MPKKISLEDVIQRLLTTSLAHCSNLGFGQRGDEILSARLKAECSSHHVVNELIIPTGDFSVTNEMRNSNNSYKKS